MAHKRLSVRDIAARVPFVCSCLPLTVTTWLLSDPKLLMLQWFVLVQVFLFLSLVWLVTFPPYFSDGARLFPRHPPPMMWPVAKGFQLCMPKLNLQAHGVD